MRPKSVHKIISNYAVFNNISSKSTKDLRQNYSVRLLSTKLSYRHQVGEEPLKGLTIGQMFDKSVDKFWHKEAIVSCHENQKMNFAEVKESVDKLASGLLATGLQKGDRLGIWATNQIQWYITFLAAAKAGLILVTLNPMNQAPEIEYCLEKVGIKTIIADHSLKNQNYYKILTEVIPELSNSTPGMINSAKLPNLKSVIIMTDEKLNGAFNLKEIYSFASTDYDLKLKEIQKLISIDDPFNVQFTSGTTGKPKATIISHHNLVNNGYLIGKRNEFGEKTHKLCVQVPLFHAFGTGCSILGSIPFGTTIVLPSPMYSPTKTLEALKKEKCTIIYGTPSMYVDLVNLQKEKQEDISLETVVTGGAPCSPHLFNQMKDILNVKKIISVYGLTEVTAVAFQSLSEEDEETTTSTVGHVTDHLEVKVIDENGLIVPIGTPGELCIRGYSTMLGYWKDEQKTKEILDTDGWFKTGDQFILQENGYGKIVGRLKDIIIRGGENIFPKEIEDFLNTHPNIKECQIIGVPDQRLGEEVYACVRLKEGTQLTIEDLLKYCSGKLAKFKIPKYIQIMDTFPKTVSGKIQKFKLKEQIKHNIM